jgi:hypothetical protein
LSEGLRNESRDAGKSNYRDQEKRPHE